MRGAALLALIVLLGAPPGCATYTGVEVRADHARLSTEPGWVRVWTVPVIRQQASWDCGLAALGMVLQYWAIAPAPALFEDVGRSALTAKRAIRAGELRALARAHGAQAFLFHCTLADLEAQLARGRPLLIGERKPTVSGSVPHFAVVVGVHPLHRRVLLHDPALGLRETSFDGFDAEWSASGRLTLLLTGPTNEVQPPAREGTATAVSTGSCVAGRYRAAYDSDASPCPPSGSTDCCRSRREMIPGSDSGS